MPDRRVAWQARQVVHTMPTEKVVSINNLRSKPHLHSCRDRECRLVYEDNCDDVRANGLCHLHRPGIQRRPQWISARDPQPCCIGSCFMVSDVKEIVRYGLAGPGPWYQCTTCFRSHGWPCN